MSRRTGYMVLGWLVWHRRSLRTKLVRNRGKLGAAAVVAAVLVIGAAASKASPDS